MRVSVLYRNDPERPLTDPLPFLAWRWFRTGRAAYIGFKLYGVDNMEKALKALGLVVAAWNGKPPAQLKAAFKTAWDSLP